MGRKKHRTERRQKQDSAFFNKSADSGRDESGPSHQQGPKQLSKKLKKLKKANKKHQVTITKEHRWYRVKVYDTCAPDKSFLQDSFSCLLDTEFTMLGFHKSQHSSRFYLENNGAAATAIAALTKRMQGVQGRLMQIMAEPCTSFLLLNVEQMAVVKQVLENRYDAASGILDMTRFHYDPLFLNANLLPVLWDPSILRQILCVVRDSKMALQGLVLANNSLRLANIKVVVGTLTNSPIKGLNLEHNEIESVKELINALSNFPLLELKLEGNNCLRDIKDPVLYIRTVQAKLVELKTLDGVDIVTYLASKDAPTTSAESFSGPLASSSAPTTGVVTQPLVHEFLKEFYSCLDSEHRQQLVNAYVHTAKFVIQSEIATMPAGECHGHDGILAALGALPPTQHASSTFVLEMVKCEPGEGQVKVSGQVQLQDQTCSFVHAFSIVPYNTGLGCSMSVLGYR